MLRKPQRHAKSIEMSDSRFLSRKPATRNPRLCSTANPDVTQSAPVTSPQQRSKFIRYSSGFPLFFSLRGRIDIRALTRTRTLARNIRGSACENDRAISQRRDASRVTRTLRRISSPISSDLTLIGVQPSITGVSEFLRTERGDRQRERERGRETGGRIIKEREEDGRERQRALWRGDATATPPQLLAEVSYDEGKQGEQRGRKEKEAARNGRAYSRGTDR